MSLNPRDAVIVDYARSAMGRSKNGCFRNVRADDLSATVIKGMLARNEALDPAEIDAVIQRVMAELRQGSRVRHAPRPVPTDAERSPRPAAEVRHGGGLFTDVDGAVAAARQAHTNCHSRTSAAGCPSCPGKTVRRPGWRRIAARTASTALGDGPTGLSLEASLTAPEMPSSRSSSCIASC